MLTVLAMALQAGAVAGPPDVVPKPRVARPCPPSVPSEDIVVCARSSETDRLRPLPDHFSRHGGLLKAEVGVLGNAKLSAKAEQGADAQGAAINRAMVHLKIPF